MESRIYVPLTVAELRHLGRNAAIELAPFTAYAVTADLRRQHPSTDEEDLEYLAFLDAAGSTAQGVARVVAAADVDEDLVSELLADDQPVTAVRVAGTVTRRQVASFHVADGRRAGDGRAGGIPEFSWYDATELEVVVDLVG